MSAASTVTVQNALCGSQNSELHIWICFHALTGRTAFLSENKTLQCQLAVAAVQTSFVIGSVYLKSSFRLVQGLHFHPVIFAFVREAIAGPVLCLIAFVATGMPRVLMAVCRSQSEASDW